MHDKPGCLREFICLINEMQLSWQLIVIILQFVSNFCFWSSKRFQNSRPRFEPDASAALHQLCKLKAWEEMMSDLTHIALEWPLCFVISKLYTSIHAYTIIIQLKLCLMNSKLMQYGFICIVFNKKQLIFRNMCYRLKMNAFHQTLNLNHFLFF